MRSKNLGEVARAFGVLGLTSFGGPTAHLGYFRTEFVQRRKWLSDSTYSQVVALCQFLPGPASSQVGMALGYHRAGLWGLVVAWLMFTAPSAVALGVAAWALGTFAVDPETGWLQGLLAAAVGVVAHAVVGMGKSALRSWLTVVIAAAACAVMVVWPGPWQIVGVILVAACVGLVIPAREGRGEVGESGVRAPSARVAYVALCGFVLTLVVALVPLGVWAWDRAGSYFYAGALVFGGGHVVLPLLEAQLVPGALSAEEFVSGYAMAQAVPGPLFTFAAFTGAAEAGLAGALLGTVAIFLPSALLTVAALHFFGRWSGSVRAQAMLVGVNAAVVGVLAATLYDPVFVHGVVGASNPLWAGVIAALAWCGLAVVKLPPWVIAVGAAVLGAVLL